MESILPTRLMAVRAAEVGRKGDKILCVQVTIGVEVTWAALGPDAVRSIELGRKG